MAAFYPKIALAPYTTPRDTIQTAESLLAQAESVVAETSSTQGNNDPDWYAADDAFQSSGDKIAKAIGIRLARTTFDDRTKWDGVAFDISNNLSQSESFLHAAVADSLSTCNKTDAEANLRVARADIRESRRDFDRNVQDPDGWSPPEIEEEGGDHCSHD
jgi:hypothetical protein